MIVTNVMWRNIIGQGIYQIAVLCVILFGKELMGFTYPSTMDFYKIENGSSIATEKTRHFTILFQAFVFMTIFNEINSRKLGDKEYNVFAGFFNNCIFIIILIITVVVQIAMVQYGGQPLRCMPLTTNEHLFCAGLGFFSLIWGVFVKALLPATWFNFLAIKESEDEPEDGEKPDSNLLTSLNRSFKAKIAKGIENKLANSGQNSARVHHKEEM